MENGRVQGVLHGRCATWETRSGFVEAFEKQICFLSSNGGEIAARLLLVNSN